MDQKNDKKYPEKSKSSRKRNEINEIIIVKRKKYFKFKRFNKFNLKINKYVKIIAEIKNNFNP
jgi:hypothetical protein